MSSQSASGAPADDWLPDDFTRLRLLILIVVVGILAVLAWVLPQWTSGWLNAGVATVYLTVFFITLGRLNFPFWMSVGARAFFLGCAGIHADAAIHAFIGEPMPTGEWHHQFFDLLQNAGGWTFIIGAAYYRTRVVDLRSRLERRQDAERRRAEQAESGTYGQLIEVASDMGEKVEETKHTAQQIRHELRTKHRTIGEKIDDLHDALETQTEEIKEQNEEIKDKVDEELRDGP